MKFPGEKMLKGIKSRRRGKITISEDFLGKRKLKICRRSQLPIRRNHGNRRKVSEIKVGPASKQFSENCGERTCCQLPETDWNQPIGKLPTGSRTFRPWPGIVARTVEIPLGENRNSDRLSRQENSKKLKN